MLSKYLFCAFFVGLSVLPATQSLANKKPDWRIIQRNQGTYVKDEFININSIKQLQPGVYNFLTHEKTVYVKAETDFKNITVNCKTSTITYNQSVSVHPDGKRYDNTDVAKIFNGQADYMTDPYCRVLTNGSYHHLPRTFVAGKTRDLSSGRSSLGKAGNCEYSWQTDSAGRKCGDRSAGSRSGGR